MFLYDALQQLDCSQNHSASINGSVLARHVLKETGCSWHVQHRISQGNCPWDDILTFGRLLKLASASMFGVLASRCPFHLQPMLRRLGSKEGEGSNLYTPSSMRHISPTALREGILFHFCVAMQESDVVLTVVMLRWLSGYIEVIRVVDWHPRTAKLCSLATLSVSPSSWICSLN